MAATEGAKVDEGTQGTEVAEAPGGEVETDQETPTGDEAAGAAESTGTEGAAGDEAGTDEGGEEREPLSPRLVAAAERLGWNQEDLDALADARGDEWVREALEKAAQGQDRLSAELGETGRLLQEHRRAAGPDEAPFAESGFDVSVLGKPLALKIPPEEVEWLKEYAPQTAGFLGAVGGQLEALRQLSVSLLRRSNEQHGRYVQGELDGFYGKHKDMEALFSDPQFQQDLRRLAQDIWLGSQRTKKPRSVAEALEAALWSMPQARDKLAKGASEKLKGHVRDRQGRLAPKPRRRAATPEKEGDEKAIRALQDKFGIPR